MRSPWQVLKSFASRTKTDEEQAPSGEASRLPEQLDETSSDQPAIAVDPTTRPQSEPSPVEEAKSPLGRQTESRSATLLPNARASESRDTPPDDIGISNEASRSSVAQAQPAIGGSDANAEAIKKIRTPALDSKGRTKPVARRAVKEAAMVSEPTAVDRATALDDEIEELRSHLSAKLREQNIQIRMLLDRYDNH